MEIPTIQPFLHYFGNVREGTMRVARCVPRDKIDWAYSPGKFTLGDLLRHIAVTERWIWGETLAERPVAIRVTAKNWATAMMLYCLSWSGSLQNLWESSQNSATKTFSGSARLPTAPKSRNGSGCG